jgi:hypothetical protein
VSRGSPYSTQGCCPASHNQLPAAWDAHPRMCPLPPSPRGPGLMESLTQPPPLRCFNPCCSQSSGSAAHPLFPGPRNLQHTAGKYMLTFEEYEQMQHCKKTKTIAGGGLSALGVSWGLRCWGADDAQPWGCEQSCPLEPSCLLCAVGHGSSDPRCSLISLPPPHPTPYPAVCAALLQLNAIPVQPALVASTAQLQESCGPGGTLSLAWGDPPQLLQQAQGQAMVERGDVRPPVTDSTPWEQLFGELRGWMTASTSTAQVPHPLATLLNMPVESADQPSRQPRAQRHRGHHQPSLPLLASGALGEQQRGRSRPMFGARGTGGTGSHDLGGRGQGQGPQLLPQAPVASSNPPSLHPLRSTAQPLAGTSMGTLSQASTPTQAAGRAGNTAAGEPWVGSQQVGGRREREARLNAAAAVQAFLPTTVPRRGEAHDNDTAAHGPTAHEGSGWRGGKGGQQHTATGSDATAISEFVSFLPVSRDCAA